VAKDLITIGLAENVARRNVEESIIE
jgi:hypothetical protein